MRKRVFGSIFLTSLVTLLLTTGLLLLAVHAGLTNDMRQRLVTESSYLSAVDNIREELEKFGSVYADRLTLVAQDGTVLYDNRTNASEMENHAVRPEIAAAEKNGTGEDNRLSETFAKQTFYYAVRLKNGDVLRISATADSVFGALSSASPWIVLIILLALLVAALLAGWLTGLFLKPIEALDLHDPMKGEAYDELSPLLTAMDQPLGHLPRLDVQPKAERFVRNGNRLTRRELIGDVQPGQPTRLYLNGQFCGIGRFDGETLKFDAMLLE